MQEEWKEIEFGYQISNQGRLKNKKGRVLKPQVLRGYNYNNIWSGSKYHRRQLHRLVVMAFIDKIPESMQVDHKNGIRNDNRVENLEIVSCRENITRAYARNGRKRDLPLGVQLLNGKRKKPYQACIRVDRKLISIGTFSDKHEAHIAYINYKENMN